MPDVFSSYPAINAIILKPKDKARRRMTKDNNVLGLQTSDIDDDGSFQETGKNNDDESLGARAEPVGRSRGNANVFSSRQDKASIPLR